MQQNSDFYTHMLNSIQATVVNDLLPELASPRHQQFADICGRLLARMRVDLENAPALAAERLESWRQLAKAPARASALMDNANPFAAFQGESKNIGEIVSRYKADSAFLNGLATPGSNDDIWFREAVAATLDYIDAYETVLPRAMQRAASPLADPQELHAKLAAYLKMRYPALPADPVLSLKIVPGGNSKETSLFELKPNDCLPTRLVLRRQLGKGFTGTSVFGEFSLLQEMDALGLPVPQPVFAEKDDTFLGGAFIVVTEITNAKCAGAYFPELNDMTQFDDSFVPDIARALARLHTVTQYPEGDALGGYHAAADPIDMVNNFRKLWDDIEYKPPLFVATELGFAYLLSHPLPNQRPRRMVHGDVGMHNLMARDGRLAAILDWELTHLGDPAEDIGYIRGTIVRPLLPWDRFVDVYVAEGGEPTACDPDAVNWYSVWAHTRNSVYAAMVYDLIIKGQRSDVDAYNVGLDYSARMQQYIVRELSIALNNRDVRAS